MKLKKNIKLSDLTEVAVAPQPIERQKVSLCLKVFSEKISKALLEHKGMEYFEGVSDTVLFIGKVLEWWKKVNVTSPFLESRFNDELPGAISDPDDPRLQTLLAFGDMALAMRGDQGSRIKKLTLDTDKAIHHTCYGLVNLCKELLSTTHEYVLLGQFSSDPLEKHLLLLLLLRMLLVHPLPTTLTLLPLHLPPPTPIPMTPCCPFTAEMLRHSTCQPIML